MKEKEMETEPTVLMQIFEIVFGCIFYIVGVVGFLFLLGIINKFFEDNSGGPTWYEEYTREK